MSNINNCDLGIICTSSFPPVCTTIYHPECLAISSLLDELSINGATSSCLAVCSGLFVAGTTQWQQCMADCMGNAGSAASYIVPTIETLGSGGGPGGGGTPSEEEEIPACPDPGDYETCILNKCGPEDDNCGFAGGGGGGGGSGDPCSRDPKRPDLCAGAECCCCDSAVMAEILKVPCYDLIGLSCNEDGSGPAPGQLFPDDCDDCFTACDLLMSIGDGETVNLKGMPWWDLGPINCTKLCIGENTTTFTEEWSSPGNGILGIVYNFVFVGSTLYAAGKLDFIDAGLLSNGVAEWTDSRWEPTGILNGHSRNLATDGISLFATTTDEELIKSLNGTPVSGGNAKYDLNNDGIINLTDYAAAATCNYIVCELNGSSWTEIGRIPSPIATGQTPINYIQSIEFFNGNLFIGGNFSSIVEPDGTSITTTNLCYWDGANFIAFAGIVGTVTTLKTIGAILWVATTSNIYQIGIALAPPTNITPSGLSGSVNAIISYKGDTIVAGNFSSINGISCNNIARYDGVNWHSYGGSGTNGNVYAMSVYNNILYIGGNFTIAGGAYCSNISRYDGESWGSIPGISHTIAGSDFIKTFILESSYIRTGGSFTKAGAVVVNNDARWYSNISDLDDFQSGCDLHCALCGQCDGTVSIDNVACQYQFTITPGSECCVEGSYETVYLSFFNHGSYRVLDSEADLISEKCAALHEEMLSNDYLRWGSGGPGFTSIACILGSGEASTDPCYECIEEDGSIGCAPCPPSCCSENRSDVEFLQSFANYLCSVAESARSDSRYEFVIFVHGFSEICPPPGSLDESGEMAALRKISDAMSHMNARIHVIKFTLSCVTSDVMTVPIDPACWGNLECLRTECTTNGVDYFEIGSSVDTDCTLIVDDTCRTCATLHSSGFVTQYCEEADLRVGEQTGASNESAVDDLFNSIIERNDRPPSSCECASGTEYVVTLDSRDCSNQEVNVCGTTLIVGDPDGRTVCCSEIGCDCLTECPPYWGDPACDPIGPYVCKCGLECVPVCPGGEPAFSTIEAALLSNWAHCCHHQTYLTMGECMEADCISIDVAQEWEPTNIQTFCKSDLEELIAIEWENCGSGGGAGGGGGSGGSGGGGGGSGGGGGGEGPGPVDIPGCGIWPPTNVDCGNNFIIGNQEGCVSVRHPDVTVLNNGIGLVAYEDTTDDSVIKIKQLHTSITNKVHPNRRLRYGRLENPSKWGSLPDPFPSDGALCKLYYYEPLGDITTGDSLSTGQTIGEDADRLFFLSGPFKHSVFSIWTMGVDDTGEYLGLVISSTPFPSWSWSLIMAEYGSSEDDRYDVQWITYDTADKYDEDKPSGDYLGTAYDNEDNPDTNQYFIPVPSGVDPNLDATVADNNAALSLSSHYYKGEKVPVAYPSITHLDNYENENENAHFVYVAYQALEDSKWKIYLRQLRLSEFKKADEVLLVESNLTSLTDLGITNLTWSCRASCIDYDCDETDKSATITSVWTTKTSDGLTVYNHDLPLGSNTICSKLFPKNVLTLVLTQKTTWTSAPSCPDMSMVMNWQVGDERKLNVPSFGDSLDQEEINTWTNSNFTTEFEKMPINNNITTSSVTAQLLYHSSQGGGWSVFNETTTQTATNYKGIYVSDPILVYENDDGHCTRPVIKTDYANRVFIAFESTENGLQQIKLVGTSEPENSLPIGLEFGWGNRYKNFDNNFNFFYVESDFSYSSSITNSGVNQHPSMWIDLNNAIHLTWHSNKDNQWDIYYANSDNGFSLTRITNYNSKSFNPDIYGTDEGNLYIVWHDNRFGPWEIMIAPYDGARIKPLFQQNEYLASIRNDYNHSINFVPITITNTTETAFCFVDITVNFYKNRTLENPLFTVKRSDHPFAFSERFDLGTQNEFITAKEYCLNPGETKEFILTITPEVFINPRLSDTTELPVGLKENQTYFVDFDILLDSGETLTMANPQQSFSCTECSGVPLNYDYESCSINFPIINPHETTKYINIKLKFYTASNLENLVATIEASPGHDLASFAVKGDRADTVWESTGFRLGGKQRVDIACYPALSEATGLLCGYNYYVTSEISYGDSSADLSLSWEKLGNPYYWYCNCQSVRWTDSDAPIPISSLRRWISSGFGFSDTRITISPGNSLNPKIKTYRGNQGIIIYQDDRKKAGQYLVYGSVFDNWPNYKMHASGTMWNTDILEARSLIWEEGGTPEILGGQNPVFDIDIYHNVFLAFENNSLTSSELKVFQDNLQSTITVHKCGYAASFSINSEDPCAALEKSYPHRYVVGYSAPEDLGLIFAEIIKQFRVKNEFVRYHITRNQTPTPVINRAQIVFDIIGTPDVVAIRLRNEDTSNWSAWIPFEPEIGDYRAQISWQLSSQTGLKTVKMQVATYQGVATSAQMSLIADYDTIDYQVNFYSSSARNEASRLNSFSELPVASIKDHNQTIQEIFIDIIPSENYLNQFLDPILGTPTFSVFTQGNVDVLDQPTEYKNTDRGKLFEGKFTINKIIQDGIALIIPHFINDPSRSYEPKIEIDKFNFFPGESISTPEFDRDETGKIKYAITSRPSEDPYFIFGDPDYRLHKENQ